VLLGSTDQATNNYNSSNPTQGIKTTQGIYSNISTRPRQIKACGITDQHAR